MSYLNHLKRATIAKDTRWICKFYSNGKVREVKQLFNPKEYAKTNRHNRPILNINQLIEILEKHKNE
tara:strand:+ start:1057 stop:1257 length:201 start_codon:yes stop_codon:yes gene_type:complete